MKTFNIERFLLEKCDTARFEYTYHRDYLGRIGDHFNSCMEANFGRLAAEKAITKINKNVTSNRHAAEVVIMRRDDYLELLEAVRGMVVIHKQHYTDN